PMTKRLIGRAVIIFYTIVLIGSASFRYYRESNVRDNHAFAVSQLQLFRGRVKTFKEFDLDGNGYKDYPASIASMYYSFDLKGKMIRLINEDVAQADFLTKGREKTYEHTWTPRPKKNYWFAIIPFMADGTPYSEKRETKYAICVFPAVYGDNGKHTFIMDETGVIYKKDTYKGELIKKWPGLNPEYEDWDEVDEDLFFEP
ncbi:DUF2950 family protein, partial [Planctomycetota bacterium]